MDVPDSADPIRIFRIVWMALVMAVVLYVVVAHVVLGGGAPSGIPQILEIVLWAMAALSLLLGIFIPNAILSKTKNDLRAGGSQEADHGVTICFIPFIVRLAMFESVVLYGLVLAFLSRRPDVILPFAAVAIVALLMQNPREQKLRDWIASR